MSNICLWHGSGAGSSFPVESQLRSESIKSRQDDCVAAFYTLCEVGREDTPGRPSLGGNEWPRPPLPCRGLPISSPRESARSPAVFARYLCIAIETHRMLSAVYCFLKAPQGQGLVCPWGSGLCIQIPSSCLRSSQSLLCRLSFPQLKTGNCKTLPPLAARK